MVLGCHSIGFLYSPTMLTNTEIALKRNDYIALIIEHNVNQGIKDTDAFVNYVIHHLPYMNELALKIELEELEEKAV